MIKQGEANKPAIYTLQSARFERLNRMQIAVCLLISAHTEPRVRQCFNEKLERNPKWKCSMHAKRDDW